MTALRTLTLTVTLAPALALTSAPAAERLLFEDRFGEPSRGERVRNRVVDPPPEGMGYTTDTPYGFHLRHWLVADAEADGPRRAFWCIPESHDGEVAGFARQAARSHNSIAFPRAVIPATADRAVVEFRQWCNDNDTIAFIVGASQPVMAHDGVEFGYQRQLPGTDDTVDDIYYNGAFGEGKIEGKAKMKQWAAHRIEVDFDSRLVRWLQDGELLLEGKLDVKPGYFGIRQRYERGTRYDDFTITIDEGPAAAADTRGKRNVLFIAVDDLNNDLGCYGHPFVRSPNLDALAASGVRFDRAYCQYPLCSPSRASVLTGRTPDATGVNRNRLNNTEHFRNSLPAIQTLPQWFQRHGYRAVRVGKVYHYGVPREIGKESAMDDRRSWNEAFYPRGAEKDEEDELISYTPKRSSGWALSWQQSPTGPLEHTDGLVASRAIQQLEALKDEPFFLAVGFYRPHVPSVAPAAYFDHYPEGSVNLPDEPEAHFDAIPPAAFDPELQVPGAEPADLAKFKRAYYATVTYVDSQIGRVVDALDDLGLADNTVVVLWSDHGWMLGEHRQWEKRVLFEPGARVPLVVRAPGAAGNGSASPRTVGLIDLYPTLVELCGLPDPGGLDGRSLVPLLDAPERPWPHPAFTMVGRDDAVGRSIRTERWRYTEWNGGELGAELYDHDNDPNEYNNLADHPAHRATRDELSATLLASSPLAPER